ncbi:hypothetical protein [Amniculibacterium aquaticum]|uniref:hypothetical protein n=1 Tax=Amniculibacterium aquaticum TaxID=2479858 RepID=UPI000F5AC7CE|nr:hypothetical protein [Amniculibacterium aquaticum]
MKTKIFSLLFLTVFTALSFANSNENKIPTTRIIEKIDADNSCYHQFVAVTEDCYGFRSYQQLGGNSGDCGTSPANSTIRHETVVDACDHNAAQSFLIKLVETIVDVVR